MGHSPLSRRDWLKVVGAAGAGSALPTAATPAGSIGRAPIQPLTSTSEVFIPPRGRAFQKFSFDFPEPSVAFGGYEFGFRVFTYENTYGLSRQAIQVRPIPQGLELTCTELLWAGGQQRTAGRLIARLSNQGG